MITFIAFILTVLGSINWLLIGLLQYDFIAGFFGFQASIFSRIIYIFFGIGAVYLGIRVLVNKGTFKIFERKKDKKSKKESKSEEAPALASANVEAGKEQVSNQKHFSEEKQENDKQYKYSNEPKEERNMEREHDRNRDSEQVTSQSSVIENLFDEHFKKG